MVINSTRTQNRLVRRYNSYDWKMDNRSVGGCCSLYLFSCGGNIQPEPGQLFQFDFANGAQGWSAGFSDYPAGQEAFFELTSGVKPLPSPLDLWSRRDPDGRPRTCQSWLAPNADLIQQE